MKQTMQKVILYYFFTPLSDPESVRHWQKQLCMRLGLKGRIIVAPSGINGTLGGQIDDVKAYVREMKSHSRFNKTEFKWSDGKGDEFPRLSVKERPELVTLAPDEEFDVFNKSKGLRPKAWHELLSTRDDLVILDARNEYESDIGYFEGAIRPPIRTFREIKGVLDKLDPNQTVATYCTGDVRCEYLSAYMQHKGFKEVYHLDGGIVKYGEQFGNNGLWRGDCYVFDKRVSVHFGEESEVIGSCTSCGSPTNRVVNCSSEPSCLWQHVLCEACDAAGNSLCPRCVSEGVPAAQRG